MGVMQIALTVALSLMLGMMYMAEYKEAQGHWFKRSFDALVKTLQELAKLGLFIMGLMVLKMFIESLY